MSSEWRRGRTLNRWPQLALRAGVVLGALGAYACDTEIDPLQSTEMAFSIYGLLDAAADTQWIRVASFRETIFSTPDPVDAVVTLEELGTGRSIQMMPALFARASGNFGDTLFAYNFWTSEPIEHGSTYRLTARRSDGATSSAVVEIPPDVSHLPTFIEVPADFDVDEFVQLHVRFPMAEGDHVGMVNTFHYFPDTVLVGSDRIPYECREPVLNRHSAPLHFTPWAPGYYRGRFQVITGIETTPPCTGPFERWELRTVRTREPWPFAGGADNSHHLAVNNIENGVGFLGGLVTNSVPVEGCRFVSFVQNRPLPTSCELRFGPGSVTLWVTVVHVLPIGMEDTPFTPDVSLRQGEVVWGRLGTRVPSWDEMPPVQYRFQGYLPGSYRLRVENTFEEGLGPIAVYCEERILDLIPGENQVEITMVRLDDFPNESVNANGCREGPE